MFEDWFSGVSAFYRMYHILVGSRKDCEAARSFVKKKNNTSQSNLFTTPTILLLFVKSSRTYFFFSGGKGSIAFGAIPRSRIVVQSVSFDPYDVDSSEKTVSATP